MIKKLLPIVLVNLFCVLNTNAQITIANQGAPAAAIVAGFVGQGLTILNPTISCDSAAYGTFSNGGTTNLGLSNGIVLTTGNASNVSGNPGGNVSVSGGLTCNDAQLVSLESLATNDCCILEFDIVPQCNQLSVRFVFGSEEYPEYVNSSYNDAFGFFISGPNPAGGNYVNKDVATLPNGAIASIDNINAGANSTYYVSNSGTTIEYDGFTTAITSTVNLVPCQTYHFKLAIADAGDPWYDSGVFIDFIQCTNVTTLNISSTPASCGVADGTAAVTVTNGFPAFTYTWSPAPGGGQGTPNATGLTGGTTYSVIVDDAYACIPADTAIVAVGGVAPPIVTVNTPTQCPGANANLTATTNTGGGTYAWAPGGQTTSSITENPLTTTTYTCTYTLAGCVQTGTGTVTVTPSPTVTVNNPSICNGSSTMLNANGATTYSWAPATGLNTTTGASVTANPTTSTTYTITGTSSGCTGTTTSTVTVNAIPTVSVNSATICNGASTTLTAGGATTFSWAAATGLNTTTGTSVTANPTTTTTYTITGTSNGCSDTATSIVTVNPVPTVSVNNAGICNGSSATLNASGANTYSWAAATGLSATTGASVTANPATTTTYTVTGTSSGCSSTATSTVTVSPVPVITALANKSLCSTQLVPAINFTSTPAGATFNWTNTDPSIGLAAAGTGNIPAFTGTNTGASAVTTSITVTPVLNGCTGTPTTFSITVTPTPTVVCSANTTICDGASTVISATSTPSAGIAYSWDDPVNTGFSTSATTTVSPTTTTTYTVTANNSGCIGSATVTVTVNPVPAINALTSETLCNNAASTATSFVSNPLGASFAWTNSTTSIGLAASGTGDILSFTALNPSLAVVSATVTVTPTLNGCTGTPGTYTLTVNPTPAVDPVANITECNSTSIPATTFASTPTGATYTWLNNNNTVGLAGGGAGNTPSFIATNSTTAPITALITVSPTLNGCPGPALTYTITINPTPGAPAASDVGYCLNAVASPLSATPSAGGTLNWYGTFAAGGTSSATAPTPSTATANTTNYYVSQTVLGCEGPRKQIQVTVLNPPTATPLSNVTFCNGDPVPLTPLSSTPVGASFTWTNSNPAIGLATPGTGNVPAFTATNSTSLTTSGVITASPTLNGCTGASTSYTITINPSPIATVSNSSACNNDPVSASAFTSVPAGATYTWANSNTSIGLAASGTGNIAAFTGINTGTVSATALVSVTPTLNTCTGPAASYTITIYPTPVAPVVNNSSLCNNATATPLTATGTGTLNWYAAATGGTSSSTAPTPLTTTVGQSSYYVSQTINGCEGPRVPLTITIHPLPTATLSAQITGCSPVCSNFTITGASLLTSCNWNMGDSSTFLNGGTTITAYCYTVPGVYSITTTITDTNNCSSTLSFNNWVMVYEVPLANFSFSPETTTILNPAIDFHNLSTGNNIVITNWAFGDSAQSTSSEFSPSFLYPDVGSYTIQLVEINTNGCRDTVYQTLVIEPDFTLYVPNAFSPNDDGKNEIFIPQGIGIDTKGYGFWIFDRWGNMIFFTDDLSKGWNGTVQGVGSEPVQEDTYVWKLKCKTYKGDKKQLSGHVTVVR